MTLSMIYEKVARFSPLEWISSSLEDILIETLQQGPIPNHIAFVLDGNRRWAKQRNLPIFYGHRKGVEVLEKITETTFRCGTRTMTFFVFSLENFHRSEDEVKKLMEIIKHYLRLVSLPEGLANRHGMALRVLGNLKLLDSEMQEAVQQATDITKNNKGGILNVCFAYTSRYEMTSAVRKTVLNAVGDGLKKNTPPISIEELDANMFTAGSPPLDLMIRTSGAARLSDFLMWQCHQNTHIEFLKTLWPDFHALHLFYIIRKWQSRRL